MPHAAGGNNAPVEPTWGAKVGESPAGGWVELCRILWGALCSKVGSFEILCNKTTKLAPQVAQNCTK